MATMRTVTTMTRRERADLFDRVDQQLAAVGARRAGAVDARPVGDDAWAVLAIPVTDGVDAAMIYVAEPHADVRALRRTRTHFGIGAPDDLAASAICTYDAGTAALAALTGGWDTPNRRTI